MKRDKNATAARKHGKFIEKFPHHHLIDLKSIFSFLFYVFSSVFQRIQSH